MIFFMGIKASTYENEVRLEVNQIGNYLVGKCFTPLLRCRVAWHYRVVVDTTWGVRIPLLLIFRIVSCVRIKPSAMQVNRLKKYILAIVNIQPRPVLRRLSWIIVKQYGSPVLFPKLLGLLHTLNYLLCSIAMVDIEIYNRNSLDVLAVCAH
jgi:hypothetical protein